MCSAKISINETEHNALNGYFTAQFYFKTNYIFCPKNFKTIFHRPFHICIKIFPFQLIFFPVSEHIFILVCGAEFCGAEDQKN